MNVDGDDRHTCMKPTQATQGAELFILGGQPLLVVPSSFGQSTSHRLSPVSQFSTSPCLATPHLPLSFPRFPVLPTAVHDHPQPLATTRPMWDVQQGATQMITIATVPSPRP